uniref:UVR domain-containing protein n=1 Tax=Calcidiscus leptoporus TaxID=127549 RepID=A0A7S0NYJ9_9EUKA
MGWTPPTLHGLPVHTNTQRISSARAALVASVQTSPFEAKLKQFAPASDLPELRSQAAKLEQQLEDAVDSEDFVSAALLRDDLSELRSKDPAALADELREAMAARVREERYIEAAKCRDKLLVLRRFQPQYQLAGLWKGNYPNHGEALVRMHYQGDMLLATKVTGDEHVPAGEVTFRAELTTPYHEALITETGSEDLVGVRVEVVSLSSDGVSQQREVERFRGEGRIAARGFEHAHYVPGQLFLMDDNVIGFLWVPLGTFVVFSRVDENVEEVDPHVQVDVEADI